MQIEFNVKNQKLSWINNYSSPVSNSQNYLEAKFNFNTTEWLQDGLKVNAMFKHENSDDIYEVTVNMNTATCRIPEEVVQPKFFDINLVAYKDTVRIVTDKVKINVIPSGMLDSSAESEIKNNSPYINLNKYDDYTGTETNLLLYLFDPVNQKGIKAPVEELMSTTGVTSVNKRKGDVKITKSDVGLNLVDNTSDAKKPVSEVQAIINNKLTNTLDSTVSKLNETTNIATEALSIAKGRNKSKVYDTVADMKNALKTMQKNELDIGDNILIKDVHVPDYFISRILEEPVEPYGYFEVSELETQYIEIDAYQKKEDINLDTNDKTITGAINELKNTKKEIDITQAEYDALGDEKYSNNVTYYITDGPSSDLTAADIAFDSSGTNLSSNNLQDIIKEIDTDVIAKVIRNNFTDRAIKANEISNTYTTSKGDSVKSILKLNNSGFRIAGETTPPSSTKMVNEIKTSNSTLTVNANDLVINSGKNIKIDSAGDFTVYHTKSFELYNDIDHRWLRFSNEGVISELQLDSGNIRVASNDVNVDASSLYWYSSDNTVFFNEYGNIRLCNNQWDGKIELIHYNGHFDSVVSLSEHIKIGHLRRGDDWTIHNPYILQGIDLDQTDMYLRAPNLRLECDKLLLNDENINKNFYDIETTFIDMPIPSIPDELIENDVQLIYDSDPNTPNFNKCKSLRIELIKTSQLSNENNAIIDINSSDYKVFTFTPKSYLDLLKKINKNNMLINIDVDEETDGIWLSVSRSHDNIATNEISIGYSYPQEKNDRFNYKIIITTITTKS